MTQKPSYEELEKEVYELRHLTSDFKNRKEYFNSGDTDTRDISFENLLDINDIQTIQDEFAKVAGVSIIVTRPDGSSITAPSNPCRLCTDIIRKTEKGLNCCLRSEDLISSIHPEGPLIRQCECCGLWDAGTRISAGGKHIGNLIIGQVRDEKQTEEKLNEYAQIINADEVLMREAFREIPVITLDKFTEISNVVFAFANQLSKIAYQNLEQRSLIKEMKDAETALLKNEQEISSIFRAAPAGIGVVSNRVLQKVNKRFCEMIGYSREELIGRNARILYPDDGEYEYVGKEKYRQIKIKGTGTVETKFLTKKGKIIDVLMSSTPLDLNDLSKGVTFTASDISYLKRKELELLESEKKYRSMMEAMDEPTYICSSEYRIEYMNPAMIKRTGNNAVGELCYKVIHGLDRKCPWCLLEKGIKAEPNKNEVLSPKDKRTYHISYSPIIHADESVSMMIILRDITEIKKVQACLQQSQKIESIGTLAGGIAHDFNNILSPIFGYVELTMRKLPAESREHDHLESVLQAAQRARDLVNQILTFSRKSEHTRKPLEAQTVIKEALKLLRSSIPSTVDIHQDIKNDCSLIMADPVQIHQIIMNLCTNAFHAMEDTGGMISVSLEEVELKNNDFEIEDAEPGTYLLLSVADTGKGMDQDVLDRIFDPYFTTKEAGRGTGLGLSVVHGIIKDYGGHIRVFSEPLKGSEVKIYLPVIKSGKRIAGHEKSEIPLKGEESILLIDDEKFIIEMQKEMLELLGYHVTSRTDSLEALELFRRRAEEFDLIITDLTMPGMNGYKLAKELINIRNDIPVILSTGFNDAVSIPETGSCGIKDFLMKPVLMIDLSQKVRKVLDEHKNNSPG